MISILQFNVKTLGNYITPPNSNIPYNPNKNGDIKDIKKQEDSGDNVYITPNIKFTSDDVKDFITKNLSKNVKNYKQLFISIDLFKKFIEYLNNKYRRSLTLKNALDYKINNYSDEEQKNIDKLINGLKKLDKEKEKSNKEREKYYSSIKDILTKFINDSLRKIKLAQNAINNSRLKIQNIMRNIELTNNKKYISQYEINLFQNNKEIALTHIHIIKIYFNVIKTVEKFNEERNKIIEDKKKIVEDKNEIIKDNKDTIKRMNVIKDKSLIDELKNHITTTTNEVTTILNEIKSIQSTIQTGLKNIKLYENNIKMEEKLMEEEKKNVLVSSNKKLERSQKILKEILKNKRELDLKLKQRGIEKIQYNNEIKSLIQEQKKEQTIIDNYTNLIFIINEQFNVDSSFSFNDNKIKIKYNYDNNLLIKENINNERIQEKIDRLIVSIYDEKKKFILNNNINVIKNIFFSYKKPFIINSKKYVIYKIKDISRGFNEDLSFKDEKNNIEGKYSFTIELTISRDDGKLINIDFMNLSCLEKGKSLQSESNKLFNTKSNYITDMMNPIIPPDSDNNEQLIGGNKTKRNKTKRNKTKRNKTKRNKTKRKF